MKKFKHLIAVLIFVLLTCFVFSDWIYSENYKTEEGANITPKKIETNVKSNSRIKVTKLETQENNIENKETEKKLPDAQRVFYSNNKKYKGIADYGSQDMNITFEFFDDDNKLIWERSDLYFGRFIISNNGNVVEWVGEWRHSLWFFDDKGEILNKYRNENFMFGEGFIWTKNSKYFVCSGNANEYSEIICYLPDGQVKFNYKITTGEIWSLYLLDDKIFVQTRSKEVYILNFKGELLKKVILPKGKIQQIKKTRDNFIAILPSYCIFMDKEFKIFSKFSSTKEYPYFSEIEISPNGSLVIIKFKEMGKKFLKGFIVLDKEGKLLAKKEIVSKKLEVNFLNESSFTLKTDKFKYLVEVDINAE